MKLNVITIILFAFHFDVGLAVYEDKSDIALEAAREIALINYKMRNQNTELDARQIGLPANPLGAVIPCTCDKGTCKCCTGSFMSAIGLKSCLEITYIPEDFAFDIKMKMNSITLYRNKVTGKNPPPMCFRLPRFGFVRACLTLYDVYFIGQNMHVCMNVGGYFDGYELFERSYDCLMFGNKGVKIVKPEQGYPIRPHDVDVDNDDEEIEDYDENVVRSAKF